MADPGYEASSRAATFIGAKVNRVPLKSDYSHDVKAMLAGLRPSDSATALVNWASSLVG
jgi:histidinol-phosphate/aromatic aminotransferase/cobyric acid decarboxylase-like protein